MIKAVVFDLWQTTLLQGDNVASKLIAALGLPMKDEDHFWQALEDDWMKHRFESFEQSAKHACRILGVKDAAKIKKFASIYKKSRNYVKPYNDVIPALKSLRKNYRIGLLSNTEYFVVPL